MTRFRFMMLFILLLIPTSATAERTALHDAAGGGDVAEVKKFLDNGADTEAKDEYGFTALHEAAGRGHGDIVKVLLEYGADTEARTKNGRTPCDVAKHDGIRRLLDQHDLIKPRETI